MSHIPFSKTSPRKKRREPAKDAIAACVRAGKTRAGEIFNCALKRNGPWNKKIYSKTESAWVQKAHKLANAAHDDQQNRPRGM